MKMSSQAILESLRMIVSIFYNWSTETYEEIHLVKLLTPLDILKAWDAAHFVMHLSSFYSRFVESNSDSEVLNIFQF